MQAGEVFVRVLYNFDYTTKDGRLVSIRQSEKLQLLKHTNNDWWQVRRDQDSKPFYVPAAYVREIPPPFIPVPSQKHEYLNMPAPGSACCHDERRQLTSVLRNELITGNYNLRADKQLFNQHVCSAGDKGPKSESTAPPGVRRNYSVVGPGGKKPVPSPRIRQLSKSLETLAEEIQFQPWTPNCKVEQTSDYNTPSPDYLDSCCEQDMFWRKNTSSAGSSVQRSSSFKFRSFRRNNDVNSTQVRQEDSDSVASRSLESLVDSGAEACSSSSYEWDKSPAEDNNELIRRISIPHAALAFKNQTYQSTDDEDSDVDCGATVVRGRPRSSSDTGLTVGDPPEKRESHLSRSESHKLYGKEQPKPLVALKRNQKVVGCRRRPALLCLPTKHSTNSLDDDDDPSFDETPKGRRRPPKTPPSPAPHEKPLRVLPGGWAEFYCTDGGGQGRLYYFHAITGLKSWKPPRTRQHGSGGGQEDKSENEFRSSRRSPKEGTKSRSPSPAASDLVLPPGWDEYYDREEQQAFYVHKSTGAKAQHLGRDSSLPGNVSEWLHNLRRNTDSSEIEDELRHKVESAAAASGITTRVSNRKSAAPRLASAKPDIASTKPEISAKPRPASLMRKQTNKEAAEIDSPLSAKAAKPPPSDGSRTEDKEDRSSGGWQENPLFQGIEPNQLRRGDFGPSGTFRSLCDEARRVSTDLLKVLPGELDAAAEEAEQQKGMVGVTVQHPSTKENDLDKLTEEALSLVDAALIEHAVNKRLTVAKLRTNSTGSDLSDEVFVSCNSDSGTIFDHDGAAGMPQPPPRRKKNNNKPPKSEPCPVQTVIKQIQDMTTKALSESSDLLRKESVNKKSPPSPLKVSPNVSTPLPEQSKPPPEPSKPPPKEVQPMQRQPSFARSLNRMSMPQASSTPKKTRPPSPSETEIVPKRPPSPKQPPPVPLERKSSLKKNEPPQKELIGHAPVYGKFSVQLVERKTFYPEITRDSVVLIPSVSKEMKDLLVTTAQESENDDSLQSVEQASLEESFRSRKGSNGSDIVAWKNDLRTYSNADEEDEVYYTAKSAPTEWFSSSDNEGRLYFFAENSNESTWSLPHSPAAPKGAPPPPESAPPPRQTSTPLARVAPQGVPPVLKKLEQQLQQTAEDSSPTEESEPQGPYRPRKNMGPCLLPPLPNSRAAKSQSMIVPDVKTPLTDSLTDSPTSPGPWATLESSGATILKEGQITRTKVMESKKKAKKNWAQAWALLTSDCMYFFKDEKSFKAMKNSTSAGGHPELCISLNQSIFGEADKNMSSKKNTFLIGTDTNQMLCQEEHIREKDSWFNQIMLAKKNLPENHLNTIPRYPVVSRESSPHPNPHMGSVSPEINKSNSLNRVKSVKIKKESAESNEDLSSENHTKIRAGLKKFFKRRPTMESLVKKGIWKDEPAFGSSLAKLCADYSPGPNPQIPKFVLECIKAIEKKPENLRTDGIYRASGNLSQVQKIRLQVDQNNLAILDQEEEIHVLTGALKLFFRELTEPLIPFDSFQKALDASNNRDKSEKLRLFRELVQDLPKPNHDTLKFLLEHLLRVTANMAFNRMHIPNLAIVFGPTLMWPKHESLNMALDLMQQNIVIECLLQEFNSIFI